MTFFDHPFHPLTVHFPIAFYFLGVFLTLVYLWRNQPEYEHFAYLIFLLSWLTAGAASLVGLIDQNRLEVADPRRAQLNLHITAGVTLLIINGLVVYMRFRWPDVLTRHRWPYLGLMTLGIIAVVATAWLGGELVYRWRLGLISN